MMNDDDDERVVGWGLRTLGVHKKKVQENSCGVEQEETEVIKPRHTSEILAGPRNWPMIITNGMKILKIEVNR